MAYIFNPDGTISTLDVKYDAAGNIIAKKDFSDLGRSEAEKELDRRCNSRIKEYRIPKKTTIPKRKTRDHAVVNRISEIMDKSMTACLVTCDDIDEFFASVAKIGTSISEKEYQTILSKLSDEQKAYFKKARQRYIASQINRISDDISRLKDRVHIFSEKKKKKKEKKKEKIIIKQKEDLQGKATRSGNTLMDIATVSTFQKGGSIDDTIWGRSINSASRKPKYGYARDRYGRIQERDHLDEDRRNEFKQAQRRQSNYDYSSYDSNDDHDGAYSSWD